MHILTFVTHDVAGDFGGHFFVEIEDVLDVMAGALKRQVGACTSPDFRDKFFDLTADLTAHDFGGRFPQVREKKNISSRSSVANKVQQAQVYQVVVNRDFSSRRSVLEPAVGGRDHIKIGDPILFPYMFHADTGDFLAPQAAVGSDQGNPIKPAPAPFGKRREPRLLLRLSPIPVLEQGFEFVPSEGPLLVAWTSLLLSS